MDTTRESRRFTFPVLERGFTLTEVLVVIVLIGVLAAAMAVNLGQTRRVSRDRARIVHIKLIEGALRAYISETRNYLEYPGLGECLIMPGWDCSYDGSYMDFLRTTGYLPGRVLDPLHPSQQYTYIYQAFPAPGAAVNGCARPFYILIALLETDSIAEARNDTSCWQGQYSNNPQAFVLIIR
jgi:prepilin-type N-terminal cleavage/methylation domain-containing protein